MQNSEFNLLMIDSKEYLKILNEINYRKDILNDLLFFKRLMEAMIGYY